MMIEEEEEGEEEGGERGSSSCRKYTSTNSCTSRSRDGGSGGRDDSGNKPTTWRGSCDSGKWSRKKHMEYSVNCNFKSYLFNQHLYSVHYLCQQLL